MFIGHHVISLCVASCQFTLAACLELASHRAAATKSSCRASGKLVVINPKGPVGRALCPRRCPAEIGSWGAARRLLKRGTPKCVARVGWPRRCWEIEGTPRRCIHGSVGSVSVAREVRCKYRRGLGDERRLSSCCEKGAARGKAEVSPAGQRAAAGDEHGKAAELANLGRCSGSVAIGSVCKRGGTGPFRLVGWCTCMQVELQADVEQLSLAASRSRSHYIASTGAMTPTTAVTYL